MLSYFLMIVQKSACVWWLPVYTQNQENPKPTLSGSLWNDDSTRRSILICGSALPPQLPVLLQTNCWWYFFQHHKFSSSLNHHHQMRSQHAVQFFVAIKNMLSCRKQCQKNMPSLTYAAAHGTKWLHGSAIAAPWVLLLQHHQKYCVHFIYIWKTDMWALLQHPGVTIAAPLNQHYVFLMGKCQHAIGIGGTIAAPPFLQHAEPTNNLIKL